jgi:polar amino acid transport system permease protein
VSSNLAEGRPKAIRAVPVRHPGRWVAAGIIAILAILAIHAIITNPRFHWAEQAKYAFDASVIAGVRTTLMLTFFSMLIGVVLGIILAVMRLSSNPLVSGAAWLYVWIFRGTPVLVQLLVWQRRYSP